jgi:CTP:phosphocholine cytidylyltransferase-like protein
MTQVEQAVISAAGLGTRLKAWGASNPKAMLVVDGKPLLQHQLESMQRYGIRHVVITVAHQAQKIINFLENINLDLQVSISNEGERPIGVLPGIISARKYLKPTPFLLQSVDTLFDEPLDLIFDGAIAKLFVYKSCEPDFFTQNNYLSLEQTGNSVPVTYAGAGLFLPEFFDEPVAENFLQQIKNNAPSGVRLSLLSKSPRNINTL